MFPSKLLCFALLPAILCVAGNRASAQANVPENQSTYIYVDANSGSDGNSGAQDSPFQTIQSAINKANSLNRQGIGVKVIVNAGVYRETVNIGSYNTTGATLTVQAANPGTAVIAGSDVLTGWNDQGSGIFSHPWYGNPGGCGVPSGWPSTIAPIVLRTEMVYVNGNPLTQVMSNSDLQPGTFFIDDYAGTLYVSPNAGVNIWSATVEAATRPQTLSVSNRSNVVLRGLVFRHAASCINSSGANIFSSNNVLIDSVQAMWNNWAGFGVYSSNNLTIQNSVSSHNGGIGFMASRIQNTLYDSNESDYNNWRGAEGALFDWGMGGTKLMFTRNTTVQNHFSYRNLAQGLWFDTDNENGTINNVTLAGNVMSGLQIEANEGPINVGNSVICANGAGVNLLNSQNVTINNNTLFNNGGSGIYDAGEIFVAGFSGGHPISDWVNGNYYNLFTTGTVITGNTIVNGWPGEKAFGTYLNGYDWSQFANSVSASGNTWYDPSTSTGFMLPNGKLVDFQGWQGAVGSDYGSSWSSPSNSPASACGVPSPDYTDFAVSLNRRSYTMSGGQATAGVRVSSYGDGPVNLSVAGLPSGVNASFSSNNLVRGQITLTFSTSGYAGWQTVPVTLWATSGDRVHSITFNLTVVPN
jgi:hypothetical protein